MNGLSRLLDLAGWCLGVLMTASALTILGRALWVGWSDEEAKRVILGHFLLCAGFAATGLSLVSIPSRPPSAIMVASTMLLFLLGTFMVLLGIYDFIVTGDSNLPIGLIALGGGALGICRSAFSALGWSDRAVKF